MAEWLINHHARRTWSFYRIFKMKKKDICLFVITFLAQGAIGRKDNPPGKET